MKLAAFEHMETRLEPRAILYVRVAVENKQHLEDYAKALGKSESKVMDLILEAFRAKNPIPEENNVKRKKKVP